MPVMTFSMCWHGPLVWQGSWSHATKKQREKLLELIRRLAEDDKEGVMAHKVRVLNICITYYDTGTLLIMDSVCGM